MTLPPFTAQPSSVLSTQARFRHIIVNMLFSILYSLFAYSFFNKWLETGNIGAFLLTIQETIILAFVLLRRHSFEETNVLWEWCVAIGGTGAPLLLRPVSVVIPLAPWGETIQLGGMIITIVALLSLRRSFGVVAANRGVRTGGLYRFVRHPLYGSYIIGYVGFLLGNVSLWNIVLVVLMFTCQYLRTRAEERILLHDPIYQAYAAKVTYRFIPFVF